MTHFYSFKNSILFFMVFCFFSCPFIGHSTIVIPPPDIGEMVFMTDYIVYGKVTSHNDQYGYINNFEISDVIKGDLMLGETILLKEYSTIVDDYEVVVSGDVDFIIDKEYLLFLFKDQEGRFKLNLMYFSVFENTIIDRKDLLAHNPESIGVTSLDDIDPNLTGAYLKNNFIEHLKQIANGNTSWDLEDAGFIEGVFISDLQKQGTSSSRSSGTPPSHCTPLSGHVDNFGTTCVERKTTRTTILDQGSPAKFKTNIWEVCISMSASDIPMYTTEIADLQTSISLMNDMPGVNITYGGINPCAINTPCGASTAGQTCAGSTSCANKIWVFFEDPCEEIPDLTGCAGVIGRGGHFSSLSSCHEDECGNMWRNASSPYLYLNNAINCLTQGKMIALMTHELLHSIGIGHISGTCTAIMNPSICNSPAPAAPNYSVTSLDEMCTDWMYGDKCLPTTIANDTGTVCDDGGTDDYESWKTSIANANPSANIVYSSVMPTVCPIMLKHDNIEPDGSHSGIGCSSETEIIMAYDFYDCDSDGNPDGGDKYTLISTYTLTVFPPIQAPTITTNNCVLTVAGQCSDDIITLSSQAIGAGVITNNGTNAVTYTAQPGDASGVVTINITSSLTGNTCTYTASTTTTPACPSTCPTLTAPTALSITSESTCGTGCAPAGGAWALSASPCPAGSSLQSFTTATATTGGTAMTAAPTYNQTTAETYHVRCVCDTDATDISAVQTISSIPGSCTDPIAPTLTITNNVCPSTTGSIGASGAGGALHYFTGTTAAIAMSNATNNTGGSTTAPTYIAFPTAVNVCVVETDANGCRSAPSCDVTAPVDCCPTFTTPTALSITSESTCGTGCAPAGGAWALSASPCPAGSSLQSFTTATATTGGTAMTAAPTYNQTIAETYHVRCVCDTDATDISAVQTISSTPGSCTDPSAPTLTITNNVCPSTTGSIGASGAGGTLHYFTGTTAAIAMSNATNNTSAMTTAPAYLVFPTAVNVCVVETDANGCRSAPSCDVTTPIDCTIPCPTFTTPTALSITSESSCGTGCAPAGGAWALSTTPCPTGSSLQSFTTATATTGGTAMTTAPAYNQTTAETYHVRCVCGSDATDISDVQTISSTPGACTDPAAPTLTITNNTCPTTTIGTIVASGGAGNLHYFTGTTAAIAMSNATNNIGSSTTAPAYVAFPTAVNVCVVETDANGCRSTPSCGVTIPVDCCPTFTTPTALSITSESSCGTGCAPAGGVWALTPTPCPAGSSLQSFASATAITGGIAMTTAPTYNQMTAETYHVRCVCDVDATRISVVQTISSTPGSCVDPLTPTLNITNNVCSSTTGSIGATGAGGTLHYFTGVAAMSNAMLNSGGITTAPAYAAFPTTVNVCVVETDVNGCRSAPACGMTVPIDCTCSLSNANLDDINCNNNNTTIDMTDDYITFTLNPTGANLGATYTVSGGGVMPNTPQTYGSPITFTLPVGSAGGGNVSITITDVSGGTCTINETVTDPGICSFAFTGNNTGGDMFMATDPCSCNGDQVLNSNGSVAVAGTFSETVTVNGPSNLNVQIKTISASTGSDPSLMALPLIETPAGSGTYVVTFNHIDRIGYNISEFEFSTVADPMNFMTVMAVDGITPVSVTNRCAYPTIVCSPALASSMQITDAPISLSATELSTDVTFLGGVTTFTINGTASSVFDPANNPVIVGNNTIVATYDFTSGLGQGGLAAPGAPAIPLDADGDPSNGVCPISLPAKTVNVIGEEQAIPTMSQWGLMIFGLLILNMGAIFLYRKEQLVLE